MSCEKNIYASLNICQYKFNENVPQRKHTLNDLGGTTNTFLNIYLPANSAFVSAMSDKYYPTNKLFNIPTITLGVNYGVIAYLFKKAEGKDDGRILGEIGIEMVATDTFGRGGKFLGNKIQKKSLLKLPQD